MQPAQSRRDHGYIAARMRDKPMHAGGQRDGKEVSSSLPALTGVATRPPHSNVSSAPDIAAFACTRGESVYELAEQEIFVRRRNRMGRFTGPESHLSDLGAAYTTKHPMRCGELREQGVRGVVAWRLAFGPGGSRFRN